MASYSIAATDVSQQFPLLKKGRIRLFTSVPIYYAIGANPVAKKDGCAILQPGDVKTIDLPVNSRIAILQVQTPGTVSVVEQPGGAKASCSA